VARADSQRLTLTALHARMVEAIRQNPPHVILGWHIADSVDFDDRGAHLDQLLIEVVAYVRAAVQDIKSKANVDCGDALDLVKALDDCRNDLVGQMLNLSDDMREGYNAAA
jgi:hypothetical protein